MYTICVLIQELIACSNSINLARRKVQTRFKAVLSILSLQRNHEVKAARSRRTQKACCEQSPMQKQPAIFSSMILHVFGDYSRINNGFLDPKSTKVYNNALVLNFPKWSKWLGCQCLMTHYFSMPNLAERWDVLVRKIICETGMTIFYSNIHDLNNLAGSIGESGISIMYLYSKVGIWFEGVSIW